MPLRKLDNTDALNMWDDYQSGLPVDKLCLKYSIGKTQIKRYLKDQAWMHQRPELIELYRLGVRIETVRLLYYFEYRTIKDIQRGLDNNKIRPFIGRRYNLASHTELIGVIKGIGV